MSVISLITTVDPRVVLYMSEHPMVFQNRASQTAAKLIGDELARTERLGGDSPLGAMGRVLSAISSAEVLMKSYYVASGLEFISVRLTIGGQGEFLLEVGFEPDFSVPVHSSITIQ